LVDRRSGIGVASHSFGGSPDPRPEGDRVTTDGIQNIYEAAGGYDVSPVILRVGPYRFYFVSHDLREPPHVHVDREDVSAKFWLDPVALAYNLGYPSRELRKLEAITTEHQRELLEAWNEYFGTASG
jgi:hypothetical protein